MKNNTTKRLLSAFLAVMFAVTMLGSLTAFAAVTGNGSITLNKPADSEADLTDMEVYAYQVFYKTTASGTGTSGAGVYVVNDEFKDFFGSEDEEEGIQAMWEKNRDKAFYLTIDTDGTLVYNGSAPEGKVDGVDYITVTAADAKELDENYFEGTLMATILGKLDKGVTTTAADAMLISEWLRQYVKYQEKQPGGNPNYFNAVKVSGASDEDSVEFEDLGYGYWLVVSDKVPEGIANVRSVMKVVDSDVAGDGLEHITATLKAENPTFTKTVNGEKAVTAAAGDILDYEITFDLVDLTPYTYSSEYKYTISDTMKNQRLAEGENGEVFTVTFEWKEDTDGKYHSITYIDLEEQEIEDAGLTGYRPLTDIMKDETIDYGSYASGEQSFELAFDVNELRQALIEAKPYAPWGSADESVTVTVEYKAELTSDAVWKNDNDAGLSYTRDPHSNKPQVDTNDEEDHTDVYDFGMDIDKRFSDNNESEDAYAEVEFELYQLFDMPGSPSGGLGTSKPKPPTQSSAMSFTGGDGVYAKADSETTTGSTTTLKLSSTGELKITGLAPGWYALNETKNPNGYELADQVLIYIDADGNTYVMTESSSARQGEADLTPGISHADENDDGCEYITFTVLNQKGFHFPSTGGMGTLLFGIGGVLLIAAAAYIFRSQKKREEA